MAACRWEAARRRRARVIVNQSGKLGRDGRAAAADPHVHLLKEKKSARGGARRGSSQTPLRNTRWGAGPSAAAQKNAPSLPLPPPPLNSWVQA